MSYGPAIAGVTPFESIGVFTGTAQKKFIASRATRSGAGSTSVMLSLLPLTLIPVGSDLFPFSAASAPTMSLTKFTPGEPIFGAKIRSNARAKLAAVSGSPVLNLKPLLTVNVYVRPFGETRGRPAAASGRTCDPSGAGWSG